MGERRTLRFVVEVFFAVIDRLETECCFISVFAIIIPEKTDHQANW
jgi:hypothetical protein